MNHRELINIARAFKYTSIAEEGLCNGFAMMWVQAVCNQDLKAFEDRMNLMDNYKSNPQKLVNEIKEIRDKFKLNKNYRPTTNEQKRLEIPAFFDGVALYLNPAAYQEIMGKGIAQKDIGLISEYAAAIGKRGLKTAFFTADQPNKNELAKFLSNLERKMEGRADLAITFGGNKHAVSARYLGKGTFEFIDTNSNVNGNMTYWRGEAKGLAEQIFKSLGRGNAEHLIMECFIVAPVNALEVDFEACRNQTPINKLQVSDSGQTVLDLAIMYDDINLFKRIDFNAININTPNRAGASPIMVAVNFSSEKIFEFLLSAPRTNVNFVDLRGLTLLDALIEKKEFKKASDLLDNPRFKLSNNPPLTLHRLACFDHNQEAFLIAEKLLTKNKITANPATGHYWSPLRIACAKNDRNMAELLLNHGANINVLNDAINGCPIHVAARNNHLDMINLLIDRGANCNIKLNKSITAFDLAVQEGHVDAAIKLLPHTTLDTSFFGQHWSLKSFNCTSEFKIEILKKGLQDYITQRKNESEYRNVFGFGYSKQEKIAAAQALFQHLENSGDKLSPQQEKILQDRRLGNLYTQYRECFTPEQNITNQLNKHFITI